MRTAVGVLLCIACACTGTRTGNPGNDDPPSGIVVARSELERDLTPAVAEANSATFGRDSRAFALALYQRLAETPGNLFFSPYSISTALAMTYAGAKGQTATEMATALRFSLTGPALHAAFNATDLDLAKRKDQLIMSGDGSKSTGDGFQLRVVNQAWGQKGTAFVPGYLDVLAANYGAGLFLADFADSDATRVLINDWVATQTEQRILDLLPEGSLSAATRLVLTNAIYFKASWLSEFDVAETKPGMFNGISGARSVSMMHGIRDTQYAEVNGFQAVSLPYISDTVRMLIILPPPGTFSETAKRFDGALFEALLAGLGRYLVTMSMPKWQFESKQALKAPLGALGMPRAFTSEADFSGMSGGPGDLYIDEVYHQAFVAVDERGTEAAAATAVVVVFVSLPPEVTVNFDRPFMFAVYDEPTGQILFLGHLADPS